MWTASFCCLNRVRCNHSITFNWESVATLTLLSASRVSATCGSPSQLVSFSIPVLRLRMGWENTWSYVFSPHTAQSDQQQQLLVLLSTSFLFLTDYINTAQLLKQHKGKKNKNTINRLLGRIYISLCFLVFSYQYWVQSFFLCVLKVAYSWCFTKQSSLSTLNHISHNSCKIKIRLYTMTNLTDCSFAETIQECDPLVKTK